MSTEDAERVRLLHVDDHADVVTPLASRLEALGEFHVTVERDADAARAALEDGAFDCVLLAERVAEASAGEFCRQVRAAGENCPILVLAESPAAAVEAGVLEAGATDVVDASSEALLALLRQRVRLVVDRGDGATPTSGHRLLAGLPLGVFAGDETVTYANDALEALAGVDLREGSASIADALGVPSRAIDPEQPDPTVVEAVRETTERTDDASGELALWTGSVAGARDASTVGAVWDLAAGSGALAEWKERSDMLDSLLASLPLAVVFRDEAGRYVAASDHVTRLGSGRALAAPDGTTHHTPADVLGKTDHDLYPTALAEAAVDEHRQVLDAEQPATDWSGRRYSLQGDAVALATTTAPWYDADGTVVGTVSVWIDVSDRVASARAASVQGEVVDVVADELLAELEAALRQIEADVRQVEEDVQQIEEDVRSRETATRTADEPAAVSEPTDEPATAEPASTVEQVAHLRDVIEDLATVADVAHVDPTTTEPTELDVVTREAWETVAGRAECSLSVETGTVIRADPDGLRQFLVEVLENAVESGAREVRIGTRELGFFVADDGPGVQPGERERVLDYGYSTRPDAVGAGLTVASLVASAHGWTLSIADSADGGTRIEVDDVRFR